MKKALAIITLLITTPIWFYILYCILSAIHVDRLVWFLYIIYIPFSVIAGVLSRLIEHDN
jgi:hypothetical protein